MADYATVIMHFIAEHPELAVSAAQVATDTGIALPTVRKVLKLLLSAHLLDSSRGANGGYVLAKSAHSINLSHIIEAIDGSIALVDCVHPQKSCTRIGNCTTQKSWQMVNHIVKGALDAVPLSQAMNIDHVSKVLDGLRKGLAS